MLDGAKRVACFLRLTNLRDSRRILWPLRDDPAAIPGVAVACSARPQEHAGIVYQSAGLTRVLHFCGPRKLSDDDITDVPYFLWVVPGLRPKQIPQVARLCALVATNRAKIQGQIEYGYEYNEASIFSVFNGSFSAAAGTTGLTCATFVLAIFRSCGVRLLKTNQWKRDTAIAQQIRTANDIGRYYPAEASNLRKEIGARRFSPPEVAGAGLYERMPIGIKHATQAAQVVLKDIRNLNARDGC